MSSQKKLLVGIGELLWDYLPDGEQLGGAPGNFAYIASRWGAHSVIASRVGNDPSGAKAIADLRGKGVDVTFLQQDSAHATSRVEVTIDAGGQPSYTIHEDVAWDYLAWTPQWETLARQTAAVCFGSLGQRHPAARETIRRFLKTTRRDALRVFDVNLRQNFFAPDILHDSFQQANITKLNHEELPRVSQMLGLPDADALRQIHNLRQRYDLSLVCVTRGGGGSWLVTASETAEHPGVKVKIADTVGAGDAFTATLTHLYLHGTPLAEINEAANRVGAWVASQAGAMPPVTPELLQQIAGSVES